MHVRVVSIVSHKLMNIATTKQFLFNDLFHKPEHFASQDQLKLEISHLSPFSTREKMQQKHTHFMTSQVMDDWRFHLQMFPPSAPSAPQKYRDFSGLQAHDISETFAWSICSAHWSSVEGHGVNKLTQLHVVSLISWEDFAIVKYSESRSLELNCGCCISCVIPPRVC